MNDMTPETLVSSDPNEPPRPGFATDVELFCESQGAQASLQYQIYLQSGLDGRSSLLFVPTVLGFSRDDVNLARAIKRQGHRIVLSKKYQEFRVDLAGQIAACRLEIDFDDHGLDEGRLAAVAPVELHLDKRTGRPSDWGSTRRIPPGFEAHRDVTTTSRITAGSEETFAEVTYRLRFVTSDWGIEQLSARPVQAVFSSPPRRELESILMAAGAMRAQDPTAYRIANATGVTPVFSPQPRGTRLTGVDPERIELRAVRRRYRRYEVAGRSFGPVSPRAVGKYTYELEGSGGRLIPADDEERWCAAFEEAMDPAMAAHLVSSLGAIRSSRVLSALRGSLTDPQEADEVRVNAIWALWKNGSLDPRDLRAVLRRASNETLVRQATKAALASGVAPHEVMSAAGTAAAPIAEEALEMWQEG